MATKTDQKVPKGSKSGKLAMYLDFRNMASPASLRENQGTWQSGTQSAPKRHSEAPKFAKWVPKIVEICNILAKVGGKRHNLLP